MSATLPPIPTPPKGAEYSEPGIEIAVKMEIPKGPTGKLAPIKKVCSKRERDMLIRLQILREQQPFLNKPETSAYRNSYIHTLYLDMLEAGFHRSFSELFALIKRQKEERERAGPDSVLWNHILLENEHEKLEELKINLTKAEAASREGNFIDIYDAQFQLARYFLSTDDKWLSNHFFESCLNSCLATPGETRKLAEAHCNMGLAVEQAGDEFTAAAHFESFHGLAKEADWQNDEGVTLHHLACTHLTRIYTSIAEHMETIDMTQFVEYLLQAHEKAKESTDKKLEGEASYRLGLGYEKNKEYEKALYFLKTYYEVCQLMEDNHGLGLACEAIARSYERQGKIDECLKHLQMFVEVAEKSGLEKDVSRACSDLGAVYNSLSRYQEAAEYFTKAFNISRSLNDKEAISASRVQYGIAIGHRMLANVSVHVEKEVKPCTKRLVEWKNARADAFEKPIPGTEDGAASREPSTEPTKSATTTPTPAPPKSPTETKSPDPPAASPEQPEQAPEAAPAEQPSTES